MSWTLHDLARHFPDYFSKKQINLLQRQIKNGNSALLEKLETIRYKPQDGIYTPLAKCPKVLGRNHQLASEISLIDNEPEHLPIFFANPLRIAQTVDADYRNPSRRVTNAGFYVYTFEIDPDDRDPEKVRQSIAEQVGWCVGKPSRFELLYQKLCEYADFRLLEMVWSGSKSCHLHVGFDIRHLSATRFKIRKPDYYFPDLPDENLRPGLIHLWSVLAEQIADHFDIDADIFDNSLRSPEQYRRLPNGIRASDEKTQEYWEIEEKINLKQMVIGSLSRTKSRGKSHFFNDPETFIQQIRPVALSRKQTSTLSSRSDLSKKDAEPFIEQLEEYLRPIWGDPKNNPRPSHISTDKDGYVINFYNNGKDQTPSSVVKGDERQLLVYSKSSKTQGKDPYQLRYSPNEMVACFLDRGEIVPRKTLLGEPSGIEGLYHDTINSNKEFYEMLGYSIKGLDEHDIDERKKLMRRGFDVVAPFLTKGIHLVHSSEGMGKTYGLMKNILWAIEEPDYYVNNRHVFVACQSYDQAEEKLEEFNTKIYESVALPGVLLESFTRTYQKACNELSKPVESPETALAAGYPNLIEYVYAEQKDVASRLDAARDKYWEAIEKIEKNPAIPVIFTVHKVVQSWESTGGTRLWISKKFPDYLAEENPDEKKELLKEIRGEIISHHIIYDEISMDDLFHQHSAEDVSLLKQMVPNYKKLTNLDFFQAYHEAVRGRNDAPSYADIQEIRAAGYAGRDLIHPGDTPEPYGTAHSASSPYAAKNLRSHYFKPKDWWKKKRNITFLTTEWRPYLAMKFMREEKGVKVHVVSFDHASPFETDDPHIRPKLILFKKANKTNIEKLVADILSHDPDAKIISDVVRDERVISHVSARGRNDFVDGSGNLVAIFMYQSSKLYNRLVIENAYFGRDDMVALFHIDQFNQTMGRTLGFRYKENGQRAVCLFNRNLWYQIGGQINSHARYHPIFNEAG